MSEKTEEFGTIPEEIAIKKHKKRIIFGKKDKKVVDKYSARPPSTEDLIESKDFDEMVSEIDEILKNESPDKIDEDEARLVDEKLKESPKIDKSHQKKDAEVRENLSEAPCEVEEKTEEFGTIPEEIAIKKHKKERREEPPALDEFIKEEKRYEKSFLDDVEKLLPILDELLEKLPDEVVDEFVQSEDFVLYEKVVSKFKRK